MTSNNNDDILRKKALTSFYIELWVKSKPLNNDVGVVS
jgi:hypothetical protein